jgi:ribosomal protein L40E
MGLEIVAALAVGGLVLWLIFEPLVRRSRPDLSLLEPEPAEETQRGIALLALKEIEFDRETGKLSQRDYETLKTRYSQEALAALAADSGARPGGAGPVDSEELIAARLHSLRSAVSAVPSVCRSCGPRPEPAARYCSRCGLPLGAGGFCTRCGAGLPPDSRFCAGCGTKVAA